MSLELPGTLLGQPLALWIGLLVDLLLKGTLLCAAACLALRLLGRGTAARRSAVWTVVFGLLLVLPLASPLGSAVARLVHGPSFVQVVPGELAAAPIEGSRSSSLAPATPPPARSPRPAAPVPPSSRWLRAAVLLWLGGAAWRIARTCTGLLHGRRAARRAARLDHGPLVARVEELRLALGIRRPVEVRLAAAASMPFVWGARRALLVLPAGVETWGTADLGQVIRHELAHVRRHDLLRLVLVDLASALAWFHPLVRAAAHRARLEIEMACDDVACRGGGRRADYARRLLGFALGARRTVPAGVPGLTSVRAFEERMQGVLAHDEGSPAPPRRAALGLPLVLLAFGMPLVTTGANEVQDAAASPTLGTADVHRAAVAGDEARVLALVDADPRLLSARDEAGMTPLALAAWNGHEALVEKLLIAGADPDVRNANGLTPLFCALDRGRRAMTRTLIQGGADLTTRGYRGRTLLHNAARAGDLDAVRILLDRGADPSATDTRGDTPLDLATWGRHAHVLPTLRAAGAHASGNAPPSSYGAKLRGA